MVPTMVLGIPGSGTTAVILVGLLVHGLRPGPYLFTEQVDKVYQIFGAMLLANVMFMALGLYAAKLFARISLIPLPILWPIVFALAIIGAYALNSSLLDVWIAMIFGVIGFLARRHGFAVAPIAVGLILGEMVETNFQNSLKMFDGDWWIILTQPLAAMFLFFAFLGSVVTAGNVLDFSDLMILGMAFPNILGVLLLSGKVRSMLDDYQGKLASGEIKKTT